MEKLNFSIVIKAPKQKVWETMLNDNTYRQWTEAFYPGSYYKGSWTTGSEIKFLADDPDGTVSGMYSRIKESRPYDFVSIQHLGEILKGKQVPWPDNSGGEFLENYYFTEMDGGTEVKVELDTTGEFKDMFQGIWPKALEKLKLIAEQD